MLLKIKIKSGEFLILYTSSQRLEYRSNDGSISTDFIGDEFVY